MRTWLKWTGIAAFGLLASTALAADHTDGSADGLGTTANPDADITDVYAWAKDDGSTVVLIMNIVGDFSDATQYAFHVGRTDAAGAALIAPASDITDVICEFASGTSLQCWAGDSYVTGDPSGSAGISSDDGNMLVHAAEHADPFFFYLDGFAAAVGAANANAGALALDPSKCPTNLGLPATAIGSTCPANVTISALLLGLLNGTYADANCTAGAAFNNFADNNVHSLVLEVDASLFAGTGDYLQVWATTHAKN